MKVVKTFPNAWRKGYVEVILKRYCTEFEITLGASDKYEHPPGADHFEEKIDRAFDPGKMNPTQPDYLVEHVLFEYLRYAWSIGDPTAGEFNNGDPYYTPVITYHGEKEE